MSDGPHRLTQYQKFSSVVRELFGHRLGALSLPVKHEEEKNKICLAQLLTKLNSSLGFVNAPYCGPKSD